ncbi:hypothetical protein EV359DRAFT_87940 [Lentinula novae-zelandiae]|nr:hypothetical protein EV359DRAFT_87940 [Lentinula novae-zelandiae]
MYRTVPHSSLTSLRLRDLSGPHRNPFKGHHLVVLATTRSFPSSVAVLVAPFELQPAPSTLQHKPPHTKTYPKTYFDPGLTLFGTLRMPSNIDNGRWSNCGLPIALPGTPGRSLLERFRKLQEDLQDATWERKVAVEKLSTANRKNSHLTTTLLYQQGLVDESNLLATRQRRLVEQLQEEVHRARDRVAFVDRMIKEYPDEGYYEVVLPPLSQLEGDLNKAHEDLRRVATLAHRLYRSDPATVLHHHHRYIGAIIEAVVAFLRRGLESDDLDVVVHNFRLALDYMQAARGVHGDLYMRSMSSIQWFFNNAVDEDEGLYRMVLEHSRFDSDRPFLTAAQHAGFAPPPDDSLEPPFHRRMFALSTPLPHSDGAGRWDDIVPALPSIDQLTADWE